MTGSWYRFEPIADVWENPTPGHHRRSRYTFKASLPNSLDLLAREVRMLDPDRPWESTDAVVQVACRPEDVRRDGGIRADARAFGHPGVRVTFDTAAHGRLTYATDVCELWQHNLRSIALGLEALRAAGRHGIAQLGQQYQGFRALGAGRAMPASHMTSDQARALIRDVVGIAAGDATWESLHRQARAASHPDRHGGDRELWDQVEQAAAVLGLLA